MGSQPQTPYLSPLAQPVPQHPLSAPWGSTPALARYRPSGNKAANQTLAWALPQTFFPLSPQTALGGLHQRGPHCSAASPEPPTSGPNFWGARCMHSASLLPSPSTAKKCNQVGVCLCCPEGRIVFSGLGFAFNFLLLCQSNSIYSCPPREECVQCGRHDFESPKPGRLEN